MMSKTTTLVLGLALTFALVGCPEEEENFPAEMCEVMAGGSTQAVTADVDVAAAGELTITEDHADGWVNVVTGLASAAETHVVFVPDEDGELVLFADVESVVIDLLEDGTSVGLDAGAANAECEAEIPEHWHLEDLTGGTTYALVLGATAATELNLVIAHHEGDHEHD